MVRILSQADLPFFDYHATAVAIDEEAKWIEFSGIAPWSDGSSSMPAFVLRLPYDDVQWHDGGDLFYPVNAVYNLGIALQISTVSLKSRVLILGDQDFDYRVTLTAYSTADVYRFSVPEFLYDEYYNDDSDETVVFKKLVEIAKKNVTPTQYASTDPRLWRGTPN